VRISPKIKVKTDTGYMGIKKLHANTEHPIRSSKYHKLTPDEKLFNRSIASQRVTNEHAICFIKRFKVLAERYRSRRKRFALTLNLISGLCNFESIA